MRGARAFAVRAVLGGTSLLAGTAPASAQAWLPPKGEAALTLGFLRMFATEHLDYQGTALSPGDMIWNNVVTDLSYGVTDRLAVRVNLPLVISKYEGAFPHPPIQGRVADDDGAWHTTFQDFLAEVRFRATSGSVAVTPFAAVAVPVTDYKYYGHGAAGRKLVEGQFGVAAGRLLDPILPDAYLQLRLMYAVPEKVLGISHNRALLSAELGYLVGPALTLRAFGAWQKTYGGWRVPIDWPARTSLDYLVHDQVNRTDYFRLGGGGAYSITGSIDVGLYGYATISAKNDVNMKALGLTVSYSASPAQLIKKQRAGEPKQ
jgi:hypothetical protein